MPASASPLEIVIVTGAVIAGCVAGATVFLYWLDRQVPSLPCSLPVMLSSLPTGLDPSLILLRLTLSPAIFKVLRCPGVIRALDLLR